MLKTVLAAVLVVVAAVLVFAATRPDSFRVERSMSIKAPAEKIFALINDFRLWSTWSPYEKLDPAMTRTYGGAARGTGAVYEWAGSGKVGQGRMEIAESLHPSRIRTKLDFVEPFEAHNTSEFMLRERGGVTEVTWAMEGNSPYIAKVMGLFFDMDKVIGKDFEAGLANLKAVAER